MTSPRDRQDGGFTLLELLIVITLLGLLLVALTGGVRFAGRAWDSQQRQSQRQGDLDAVQAVLRQLIVSSTKFEGDAISLRFIGTPPAALARGGLYDMELRQSLAGLILTWRPHFTGPIRDRETIETELIRGVTQVEFAYYRDSGKWEETQNASQLPTLVRIALRLADGRPWPPLVVAPMIELQSGATN